MAESKNTTRTKFTAARVQEFACPPGQREAWLWDTATPGLALRAQGESVAWVWQRKLNGRAVRMTIGNRESWPMESVWTGKGAERREIQRGAREEARRLSGLADSGIDPRNERAAVVAATEAERLERGRAVVTLGEVWAAYVAARSEDWSEGHKRDHEQAIAAPGRKVNRKRKSKGGPLYPLQGERLEALTPARLERWLEAERKTRPAFTARAFRLLRACLRWAEGRPEYAGLADPARVLSGDVRRKVPRVGAREDCLQREQLPAWFEVVQAIGEPVKATYLQALLLTGARREEIAALRWNDVDFQWQALTIRDKVDGTRIIPLTPYLAALLDALPRRVNTVTGNPNPWVFSSVSAKTGRMAEANHAHTLALQAAGLPHVTLHGLRRSFGTLSEWVECPVGVVAQIMGHKPSAIAEKHYRRRPLDLLRLWHTKIEVWILTEAGSTASRNE
jgi:integrase